MGRLNILIAEKEFSEKAKKILAVQGKIIDFGSRSLFFRNLPRADAVLVGLEVKFDKSTLERARRLKVIGTRTTQMRHIDLAETKKRGIKVINIKASSSVLKKIPSTAEETFALLLALVRKIPWAFEAIKKEKWDRRKYGGNELEGKSLGLIGFGRLGKLVARYARAFGMKVMAHDPYISKGEMKRHRVHKIGLMALLKNSDIVSLHAVYNNSTHDLLKEGHFRVMRKNAVFINTARGEITNEKALLKALQKKWIAAAAVDTLAGETPNGSHLKNNPLVKYARGHENLIIVPHLGGATQEATEKTQVYIAELVANYLKSKKHGQ